MRLIPAAIALAALIATVPIDAAPLCRDSKGLFTPCIGARPPETRKHALGATAADHTAPDRDAPRAGDVQTADTAQPGTRKRPPHVGRGKLCRDSKGLFTPC